MFYKISFLYYFNICNTLRILRRIYLPQIDCASISNNEILLKYRNCLQNNGHFLNPSKIIAYACRNISQQIGMQGIRNVRRMKSALIP